MATIRPSPRPSPARAASRRGSITRSTLGSVAVDSPAHDSAAYISMCCRGSRPGQLRALDATVREGTLEAAARALHVTPSAISQRLRALEAATGRVLLVRSQAGAGRPSRARPCCASPGRSTCSPPTSPASSAATARPTRPRAADRGQRRLDGHLGAARAGAAGRRRPASTCTARTRSTPARCCAPARHGGGHRGGRAGARLHVDPAGRHALPADGRPGASSRAGSPTGPRPEALARAPVVVFDRKDDLQHRYLRRRGAGRRPAGALRAGLGGLRRRRRAGPGLGHGARPAGRAEPGLVELDPAGAVDVVLYWQQWRLRSPTLDRVREAVLAAAGRELDQELSTAP